MRLTKEQQLALKRKFETRSTRDPQTYIGLRRLVQPIFFGDGAVFVPWCNMMVAIERDGYAHT